MNVSHIAVRRFPQNHVSKKFFDSCLEWITGNETIVVNLLIAKTPIQLELLTTETSWKGNQRNVYIPRLHTGKSIKKTYSSAQLITMTYRKLKWALKLPENQITQDSGQIISPFESQHEGLSM